MEKRTKKGKRFKVIILAVLIIALAGLAYYYFYLTPTNVVKEVTYQTDKATRGDIELVLEKSGTINYSTEENVNSDISGTINNLYINKGDFVEKGDIVLDIDDRSMNISLKQAKASLELAKLNLAELLNTTVDNIDNVSVADLTTVHAPIDGVLTYDVEEGSNVSSGMSVMSITNSDELYFIADVPTHKVGSVKVGDIIDVYSYDNYEYVKGEVTKISNVNKASKGELVNEVWIKFSNTGINEGMKGYARIPLTETSFSQAEGQFKNSAKASVIPNSSGKIKEIYVKNGENVKAGMLLFKIDSTSLELSIEKQKNDIKNRELTIQDTLLKMENTTVKSKYSGVVTELEVEAGDSISPGTLIASLVSDNLVAKIDIDELDVGKVKLGQEAKLIIPGFSATEEIIGTVSEIADTGTVLDGITTYEVHINFENNDKIKEGMTVETTIIVDTATNVLKVPSSSIKTVKGDSAIQVLEDGVQVMKPVEIGISDDFYTEIISGIDENAEIITSSGEKAVPATSSKKAKSGMGGMFDMND